MQDDVGTIDDVDFSILKVIQDADRPLWKKAVHRMINNRRDELPILGNVAAHTVGRRIDNLHNASLLESTAVSPDQIDREFVIAFILTEEGEAAVTEKRRAYLRNIVRRDIFRDFRGEDVPKQTLLTAIKDEFDLPDAATEKLGKRFDSVELASLLALYYVELESQDLFTEQTRRLVRQVARGEKKPDEAIDELD